MPLMSQDAKVRATNVSLQAFVAATPVTVANWTELLDIGASFDDVTGLFTAPTTGFYQVDVGLRFDAASVVGANYTVRVFVNGASVAEQTVFDQVVALAVDRCVHVSMFAQVVRGQIILIQAEASIAAALDANALQNYLTIIQVP